MSSKSKRIAETDELTDLNITDGTAGQVLTTNGAGSFSFQDVPDSLLDLNITDGTAGQVLTTNGAGSFSFQDTVSSSGGSRDFTATGALSNGDIVALRSDATVEKVVSATNAASWIGIANGTSSGSVTIIGGVVEGLSGLTTSTCYYVNYDGTLTATENAGPVTGTYGRIGKALSSSKLLITSINCG